MKHDQNKPPMGLLSSKWLVGVARVLGFGANKYASHNWRKGIVGSRLYDAAFRHLAAWNDGEDLDPESGLPHLYHASCCLMFLSELMETRPELDDRYKPVATPSTPATCAHDLILEQTYPQQARSPIKMCGRCGKDLVGQKS